MTTFFVTWDPNLWNWPDPEGVLAKTAAGELHEETWSTGRNRKIPKGSRIFLVRQKTERGIVGSGTSVERVFPEKHWNPEKSKPANYVRVLWNTILPAEDRLPVEELIALETDVNWQFMRESGGKASRAAATLVEQAWATHLARLGRVELLPHELAAPRGYVEGARQRIYVNAYERNPKARAACIAYYGPTCQACEFDFVAKYGPLGKDFIHVHHLLDLAAIDEEYEVDPVEDLLPVCPNCHAMLHREFPAMRVEKLKGFIEEARRGMQR